MAEFRAVREKIAEMVRASPNEMLAQRYQEGLVEFDKALAVVREYLEALGLMPREADHRIEDAVLMKRGQPVFVAANEVRGETDLPLLPVEMPVTAEPAAGKANGRVFRSFCWLLLFLTIAGFGGWAYFKLEEERKLMDDARVAFLERQGAIFIDNRRWPEAEESFDEIEKIYPDSELVVQGRRSIEAGMVEEQSQFIGYWKGEAIASFETGRWADAESAARQVLGKYPDEKEIILLMGKIGSAKQEEERLAAFNDVRKQVEERKFDAALSGVRELIDKDGNDKEALALLNEVRAAKEKAEADLVLARGLLDRAAERDTGQFDEEAMNWLREAVSLAPDDKLILAKYEKMAAYTRTIRIPEDVKTVQEALAAARDRDRLVLAEGTWEGPFLIGAAVELEGVSGKTIVQCPAGAGSVISIRAGVKGARVSGLTIRHLSFDAGDERFSLVLVGGAHADFSDCHFMQGSGHGLAVMERGHAKVVRCRFSENGWNGMAVMGLGSLLEADGNNLNGNFQNGIESWNEAAVILRKNTCTGNSRNGIHADNGSASAAVFENELSGNGEFGLVIGSAGSGQVTGNKLFKNFLGGMVVKAKAGNVTVKDNEIRANGGPGLVLDKGISETAYLENRISGNAGEQVMTGLDLSSDK
ncbi:MAG: right-handed parallel beta-helix repeat-containing protein [Armatimonadetes bacterium]|nr:right-handed parallel beta-helix repeat-containing protein [Akkermansiaceae bacterium]